MSINALHPSALDFKKNEVKTILYLKNWNLLKSFPDLSNDIELTYYKFPNENSVNNRDFEFHSDFLLDIQGTKHRVLIEAKIAEKNQVYSEATYSLSVINQNEPDELIRKFHFDHAHPSIPTPSQPVPIFHLQYGGKMSPSFQDKGIKDSKMEHWLSLPRLNFQPINLAILLDIALSEFRSSDTAKVIETSEWRSMIFDNERLIVTNYHNAISDFNRSQQYNNKRLIRDFCYGK